MQIVLKVSMSILNVLSPLYNTIELLYLMGVLISFFNVDTVTVIKAIQRDFT